MSTVTFQIVRGNRRPNNKPSMLTFLRNYDPIREKYELKEWDSIYSNWEKGPKKLLTTSGRAKASRFESLSQYGALSKHKYSTILDNLKLVYGEPDTIHSDIIAYHLVERKIVHEFLAISQLDKMFDEDYFNFEWDMHVGQDFNEHRSDYYRDHFIHQIRDMYMMLMSLEKCRFYHSVREILSDNNTSSISAYFGKKKQAFLNDRNSQRYQLLNNLCNETQEPWTSTETYADEYFCSYVIKASCILAGLFHDMGYPICHFLQTRNRLSNYNPTMYMVTHNEVDSFDQIASILSPSLLFTIVSLKSIKASLEIDKRGKYDHGSYSAIAFLLQFYNNGMIFSLPPEQQCAIELAAVAIYDHTLKYKVIDQKSKSPYYSLYYRQNPIAFLLRVCDDLQEWDRRYFEISEASDLMFCRICHTPLIKKTMGGDSSYICCCKSNGESAVHRPDIFMKRKLYLVSMADTLTITNEYENLGSLKTIVRVDYDLYKLLMMTNINNTYAKYRFSELAGLQKLLKNQSYGSNISTVDIGFFMSANPILIKLEILQRFIKTKYGFDAASYNNKLLKFYRNPYDLLKAVPKIDYPKMKYKRLLRQYMRFYLSLLLKKNGNTSKDLYYNMLLKKYKTVDPFYYEVINELILDALVQFSERCSKGKYANSAKEALLYSYISAFTCCDNSFNSYDMILNSSRVGGGSISLPYIGYFFDMWVFKIMWDDLR